MTGMINSFMQWVSVHPHLTGFIVGVIACSEALAFIGLVVPGTVLMLAAGALVGVGLVDFWSIFAWAVGDVLYLLFNEGYAAHAGEAPTPNPNGGFEG